MSTVTEGKDYFRNFLHIELDKLLDQAPDFGYIEFHIALKNRPPFISMSTSTKPCEFGS
jgi:hypothetical protein